MNQVIDIRSLNFAYGSVPTLSEIDLQVADGEFLGIVDPNADGKSKLLKLPAAVARHYVHSLGRMMLIATLVGAVLSIAGLALSYGPDLPAGLTIILLVGGVYVLSAMIVQVLDRHRAKLAAARGVRQGQTSE